MKSHKFAFTLAELMIVLSVIGILSAILLPVAFQSTPDKDILKFKKAHYTFAAIIRELATSGKYFKEGDLNLLPDETVAHAAVDTDPEEKKYYFIKAMSDVVNAKKTILFPVSTTTPSSVTYYHDFFIRGITGSCNSNSDYIGCVKKNMKGGLSDSYCGVEDDYLLAYPSCIILPNGVEIMLTYTGSDFRHDYYHFQIDIDGKEGHLRPFLYLVRKDGKIITDLRADWWLKRDITKKEDECCPKAIGSSICSGDDVPVCAE